MEGENLQLKESNQEGNNAPGPPYSVRDAMVLCGVDDTNLFDGKTAAQRLSQKTYSVIHLISVWIKLFKNYKMISNNTLISRNHKGKSESIQVLSNEFTRLSNGLEI